MQIEVDTAFLYESIAKIQKDHNLNRVLQGLATIEKSHATNMLEIVSDLIPNYQMPRPSFR